MGFVPQAVTDPASQLNESLRAAAAKSPNPAVNPKASGPLKPKATATIRKGRATGNAGSGGRGRDILPTSAHIPYGQPGYNPALADPVSMGLAPTSVAKQGAGMLGKAFDQIGNSAVYAPAGVYDLGKAVVQDTPTLAHDVTHPTDLRTPTHLATLGKAYIHQTAQSFEHPGRYPGYFALNLLGGAGLAGGAVARLGAAADAARAGDLAGAVTRSAADGGSLLHKPIMPDRTFTLGTEKVNLLPSENPVMRLAQEIGDRVGRKAIAENPGGKIAGHYTHKLGAALSETSRWQADLHNVAATELQQARKEIVGNPKTPGAKTTAQENLLAIRQVAKQVTAEEQIALHEAQITKGEGDAAAHIKQIGLLHGVTARGLLTHDPEAEFPVGLTPGKISAAEQLHHELGLASDQIIRDAGLMTDEGLTARRDAPGKIIAGARYVSPTDARLGKPSPELIQAQASVDRLQARFDQSQARDNTALSLDAQRAAGKQSPVAGDLLPVHMGGRGVSPITERLGGALSVAKDDLERLQAAHDARVTPTGIIGGDTARPGKTFVSDRPTEPKSIGSVFGRTAGPVIGKAKSPIRATQPYTGGTELSGKIPTDPLQAAARHFQELTKYANSTELRSAVARMGHDTKPEGDRWVLVNDQSLKTTKIPDSTRVALGQKNLTSGEIAGHVGTYEQWLHRIIPGLKDNFAQDTADAVGADAPDGMKWVDKNLLGDLAKPSTRLEDVPGMQHVAGITDAINNASKAAGVYLKPGHFATRLVTNATLGILHGGVRQIGWSVKLFHQLTDRERLQMGAIGGQGYVHAVYDPAEGGLLAKAAGKGANFWAHVDSPFRFLAVAREMKRLGFNTTAKVQDLLENPDKYGSQLDRIAKRANRENIQYDNLNPFEKEIVRRVIWFYPWVKGASVYAGRLIYEHPIKTAAINDLGQQGSQQAGKDLGPGPWYDAGMFKVGGTDALPLTINPGTLNVLQTPADMVKTVEALAGGKYGESGAMLSDYFPPALKAGLAVALKQNQYGDAEPGASAAHILDQQFSWLPPLLAVQRLQDLGYLKGLGLHPALSKQQQAIQAALAAHQITRQEAAQLSAQAAGASKKINPPSLASTIEQPTLGTWFPRVTNRANLNAAAEKDMSPAEKLHFELGQAVAQHVISQRTANSLLKEAGK